MRASTTNQRIKVLRSMKPDPDNYLMMNFEDKEDWQGFKSRLSKFNNSEGKQYGKFIHAHISKGMVAYLVCVDLQSYIRDSRHPETRNDWLRNLKKN